MYEVEIYLHCKCYNFNMRLLVIRYISLICSIIAASYAIYSFAFPKELHCAGRAGIENDQPGIVFDSGVCSITAQVNLPLVVVLSAIAMIGLTIFVISFLRPKRTDSN